MTVENVMTVIYKMNNRGTNLEFIKYLQALFTQTSQDIEIRGKWTIRCIQKRTFNPQILKKKNNRKEGLIYRPVRRPKDWTTDVMILTIDRVILTTNIFSNIWFHRATFSSLLRQIICYSIPQ